MQHPDCPAALPQQFLGTQATRVHVGIHGLCSSCITITAYVCTVEMLALRIMEYLYDSMTVREGPKHVPLHGRAIQHAPAAAKAIYIGPLETGGVSPTVAGFGEEVMHS